MHAKIEVSNASFSYDGLNNIFNDIEFTVERGEIFTILGPNGTGKSTLLRCICNLHKLNSGSISLDGLNVAKMSISNLAKKVGFVPQAHNPIFPYTVMDVVLMGRTPHLSRLASPSEEDYNISEQALREVNVEHLKDRPYNQLSEGEMQLVIIARVLAQKPEVLLLDEPTSHLDVGNQIRTLEIVKKLSSKGLSIVMTTHCPDHVFMLSHRVGILKDTRFLAIGKPADVMTEDNLKKTYGVDIKIIDVQLGINRKICAPLIRETTMEKNA